MRVVRWCKPENDKIDVVLLEHISPIEWDNVILYGQYVLALGSGPLTLLLKDISTAIWAVP